MLAWTVGIEVLAKDGLDLSADILSQPEEAAQHRHQEHESTNQRRHRVAWKPKHPLAAEASIEQGLSRPHGDRPEIELHAFGAKRRADEVALANRRPANRDQDVSRTAGAGERDQALRCVLGDAETHGLTALGLDQSGKPGRDRGDDLVALKLGAGGHHLVAGGKYRELRLAPNGKLGM